jgi:hypothetical protein
MELLPLSSDIPVHLSLHGNDVGQIVWILLLLLLVSFGKIAGVLHW